jgi:DNA-binding NtrC family response regulator
VARVLLVFTGGEPTVITLPDAEVLTIGRGADADIRIDDRSLSRVHARLRFGMHVTLEDLGSSNGTFMGSTRLMAHQPAVIAPGVTIQFGKVTSVFHFGAIARRLHDSSHRAAGPYVVLGASTLGRAVLDRAVVAASGGTLVIDEPSALDPAVARLLIDRITAMPEPPRLVSTSTRDLRRDFGAQQISPELYHRLAGVSIVVPPLRKRVHEIAPLAHAIAAESAQASGRSVPIFATDALAVLERHTWPGNIRELASCIQSALALGGSRVLTASHFADLQDEPANAREVGVARVDGGRGALHEARERMEYQQIIEALRATRGNQTRAAEALGMSRSTLLNRLAKYGVPRPRKS